MSEIKNLLEKGIKLHKDGNLQEAEKFYAKILTLSLDYMALHLLGVIRFQNKNYKEAIILIEESLKINPIYYQALSNLGNCYRKLSQYDKAIECYEKALKINPEFIDALSNLGSLHLKKKNILKVRNI